MQFRLVVIEIAIDFAAMMIHGFESQTTEKAKDNLRGFQQLRGICPGCEGCIHGETDKLTGGVEVYIAKCFCECYLPSA